MSDLYAFVEESNRIEGIHRKPTEAEVNAHEAFLELPEIRIPDLQAFVDVIQPGAKLRNQPGMNVRVGLHVPPYGGREVEAALTGLLVLISNSVSGVAEILPWAAHVEYETLHPFMDGNGRSGRVLWAWMMAKDVAQPDPFALPFLHRAYYQALDGGRAR